MDPMKMWEERYGAEEYAYGTEPNDFLRERFGAIPAGGRVLCLADGEGRNGVFLAKQGYDVTSVDLAAAGLEKGRKLAAREGVSVNWVHANLRTFDYGEARWDGVVSIFCHLPPETRRAVHAEVVRALRPGGVFLLEGYEPSQIGRGTGGPPVPEMMHTRTTLTDELDGLTFEHLEAVEREVVEGRYHTGMAAVVQAIARKSQP